METSYETETKNKTASTWAGFWYMIFVTSLMVAVWGEPDLIDALIYHLSHRSFMGRARPNRCADIPPLRWVLQMKKLQDTQQLGISVYILAMRKEIEKEVESRYRKRINYLVGANNELMKELEVCEGEIITVSKERIEEDETATVR